MTDFLLVCCDKDGKNVTFAQCVQWLPSRMFKLEK